MNRFLGALLGALAVACPGLGGADRRDDDALVGHWELTGVEVDGKSAPEDRVREGRMTLSVGKGRLRLGGPAGSRPGETHKVRVYENYSFKLDPSVKPRAIDMKALDGKDKGNTMLAIYSLDKDTLRLCAPADRKPGHARPTAFATTADSGTLAFTFRRAKPEPTKFDGNWALVASTVNGKEAERDSLSLLMEVKVKDKMMDFHIPLAPRPVTASFTFDDSKYPPQIDLKYDDGKTRKGIYEFDGGVLTFCLADAGKDRPEWFESPKDSDVLLMMLKPLKP